MKRIPQWFLVIGLVVALVITACAAPKAPSPAPEKPGAATPTSPTAGKTREQQLIDAAKANGEKEVVLWTMSWNEGPIEQAFEAKYPFLKLKASVFLREAPAKIREEYKAGIYTPDVIQLAQYEVMALRQLGILGEYEWPNTAGWKGQPKHGFWRDHQATLRVPMYNTKLVLPADVPTKWEDLNDAKWRGKGVISSSGGDYPLFHAYLLGDVSVEGIKWDRTVKFWKDVVTTTRPVIGPAFSPHVTKLMLGEYSIMFIVAGGEGIKAIRRGGPIDFAPIKKVAAASWSLALTKNSPHPNAARLLLDFLTSEEGALIHADTDPNPTYHPQAAKRAYANRYFERLGIEWVTVPQDLLRDEDINKAIDLWSKEVLGGLGR